MRAKHGSWLKARHLHDDLNPESVVGWNALIDAHTHQGRSDRAVTCFGRMICQGIPPTEVTLLCILKACSNSRAIYRAKRVHAQMVSAGVLKNIMLGTALINMYMKVGLLAEAQQVHDQLSIKDVVSWSTLISGYAQESQGHVALDFFGRMQDEGISPNAVTKASSIKACAIEGLVQKGRQIHSLIFCKGMLESDYVLGTALVDMYVKCDTIVNAERAHDLLCVRDIVAWSALITGYVEQRQVSAALNCFRQMLLESIIPDIIVLICILKAYRIIGDVKQGKCIHVEILNKGLHKKVLVGVALMDMYVECGMPEQAQKLHNELAIQDVASWNTLIAGYAKQGRDFEVLACFEQMKSQGLSPNAVTFTCALKSCSNIGAIEKGQQIHKEIVHSGILEEDVVLGTTLVGMYAKCGLLSKAEQVHEELFVHDVVSWSALIAGCVNHARSAVALDYYEQMKSEGFSPDIVTFISILKACSSTGAINKGKKIHEEIIRRGLIKNNSNIGTALVDMYVKCGDFEKAWQVHQDFCFQNVASWSALIGGYHQHGQARQALRCFEQMQDEGLSPDTVAYVCALKVCSSLEAAHKGLQIHEEIAGRSLLRKDVVLATSLVNMYAKCGMFAKAQQVHAEFGIQNVVSWNALIAGYAQHRQNIEALNCFEMMKSKGLHPNAVTYICVVKTFCNAPDYNKTKRVQDDIFATGVLEKDIKVGTALIDTYAKVGSLVKAQQLHRRLSSRDTVSWSTLIARYAQCNQGYEALKCFKQMNDEGISPDAITLTCILEACANIGAIEKGKEIHNEIVSKRMLKDNTVLGTALIDMYAKCGVLAKAREIFEELPVRNVVTWSSLIAGYLRRSRTYEALNCLKLMQVEGLFPDEITFRSILYGSNELLLLNDAQMYFTCISEKDYKLTLHWCIQMAFISGYIGYFEKTISFINAIPFELPFAWFKLLAFCRKWGNMELGRKVFLHLLQAVQDSAAACITTHATKRTFKIR